MPDPKTLRNEHGVSVYSLVEYAIARVSYFENERRRIHAQPSSSALDRSMADTRFSAAEREFSGQWRNVRDLLYPHLVDVFPANAKELEALTPVDCEFSNGTQST